MERQFTATVYIFKDTHVLLHKHPKLGKWLPAGGHVEKYELPHEAAIREAMEETGLNIEMLSQDNVTLSFPHAHSMPRPYVCLLENIPEYKGVAPHQHIDLIYLSKVIDEGKIPFAPFEWLSYEETLQIPDSEIFADTRLILEKVFENRPVEVK